MKKFFINLSLVLLGIFGTIGFQEYFSDDEQATPANDSTQVDSASVVVPVVVDTAKSDSAK